MPKRTKNPIKRFILKMENSWIFWAIFIIGIMALTGVISGYGLKPSGILAFPLGFLIVSGIYLLLPLQYGTFQYYVFAAIYYGVLGFLLRGMVKDKRFNMWRVIIFVAILILTMMGCSIRPT